MAASPDAPSPKPRKRSASKASSRPDAERLKLTLYLDADMAKRFSVHAAMTGVDRSTLFAEMVRVHCRRFVVSDRERVPGEAAETDAT